MISVRVAVVQCGSRAGGSPRIAIRNVPPGFCAATSAGANRPAAIATAAAVYATLRQDVRPNGVLMTLPSSRRESMDETAGLPLDVVAYRASHRIFAVSDAKGGAQPRTILASTSTRGKARSRTWPNWPRPACRLGLAADN